MVAFTLSKSLRKILVVSPIYDRIDKLSKVEQMLPQYDWVIFNSGLSYSEDNINQMNRLLQTGKVTYNLGSADWKIARSLNILNDREYQLEQWILNKPNVVMIDFPNAFQVIIVNGGIPCNTNREQLKTNLESSFVSTPWHETYTGGLGYVISNNPLTVQPPRFYRYSAQIGNTTDVKGQVYALEINQVGVNHTILL